MMQQLRDVLRVQGPVSDWSRRMAAIPQPQPLPGCTRCGGTGRVAAGDAAFPRRDYCPAPGCMIEAIAAYNEARRPLLREREQQLLASLGECLTCHGLGLVHPSLPDGRADRSRHARCQSCGGAPAPIVAPIEHVPGERASPAQTFATFRAASDSARAMCVAVRAWAESPAVPWLYLQGVPGCGKTHLLMAVRAFLTGHGEDAHYISVPDWLRAMYGLSIQQASATMSALQDAPWLLLDQFGQSWGADETRKLEELLDRRYGAAFTLIASDRAVSLCPSERLRSRLSDVASCLVVVSEARDYRPLSPATRERLPLCGAP